jgi:NAD(P)-dependent dehydrogenase (short-subunit alcohol dehydrogenase family)
MIAALHKITQGANEMTNRALVIGASGGIGTALAAALAERGAVVTRLSRSGDGFDITDPEKVTSVLRGLEGVFDMILVASGILAPEGGRPEKALSEIDADTMADVFAANTIGPALVLRHLPRLLPREGRAIVGVISARVGSIGDNRLGGWYSYRASKAAVNQIVHTAAIEIARKRPEAVLVALHPGTVETAFTQAYYVHDKVAPEVAAANLLAVMDRLSPAESGGFYDWAGKPVPW